MLRYKVTFSIIILALCLSSCTRTVSNKETSIANVTPVNRITPVPDNTATSKPIEENGAAEEDATEENAVTTSAEPTSEGKDTTSDEPVIEGKETAGDEPALEENKTTGENEAIGGDPAIEENDTTSEELTLTGKELENQKSMQAYEKFMNNETKISFDRFMPEDDMEGALYNKGSEYTLSEVLDIVTASYFEYSTNKKIKTIDYGYIDCGKDGVNELVLRFNGMDIYDLDDDSTLVYIIKYINGKLSLCYYYETWARSVSTMNEYGYYKSGGSNGASNHSAEYSLIDKAGNWQFIVSIESELDINQLVWSDELRQIPKVAETEGISGGIELDTIYFDSNENAVNPDEIGKKERFYTFYVYDDNWEPIEDPNLYTNSVYKKIFDEAKIPFITPDDITAMVAEKEEKLGVTAEIKEGAEITWKSLSGDMFSDYVGR